MSTNSQPITIGPGNLIQAVHYDLYLNYPDVIRVFQEKATELLGAIPGTALIVTLPMEDPRHHKVKVTADKDPSPHVGRITKITVWQNAESREAYLTHPNLIEWCEWILNGWRLRGSTEATLAGRRQEFVQAVLSGSSLPTEWAEDLEVPDDQRPWLGEALSIGQVICTRTP